MVTADKVSINILNKLSLMSRGEVQEGKSPSSLLWTFPLHETIQLIISCYPVLTPLSFINVILLTMSKNGHQIHYFLEWKIVTSLTALIVVVNWGSLRISVLPHSFSTDTP